MGCYCVSETINALEDGLNCLGTGLLAVAYYKVTVHIQTVQCSEYTHCLVQVPNCTYAFASLIVPFVTYF